MERNESALAIVIQTDRSREIDRTLTLLSPTLGLIKVRSFGSQKGKKANKASLYTEGTFYLYNKLKTYTLKDVSVISTHLNLLDSLETNFASALMSEIVMLEKGEDKIKNYELFTSCLDSLNKENYKIVLIQYILRFISLSGHGGDFLICPKCMKLYTNEETLGFSYILKTPCCHFCDESEETFILPINARKYLRDSLLSSFTSSLDFVISDNMLSRILNYLLRYLSNIFELELKCLKSGMLNFLD